MNIKEWWLWVVGWIVYPLIVFTDRKGDDRYHQARLALKDWLHSWPSTEKRHHAHEFTHKPEEGW